MSTTGRITPDTLRRCLLAALLAAGCAGDPAGPAEETGQEAPLSADLELQVATDETVAEAMIEDAALWVAEAPVAGPWAEARELFRQARRAWRAGDAERAAELALEGRLILAAALIDRRGPAGLEALRGHVEAIVERLSEVEPEYARLGALGERLDELLRESDARRESGDLVGAAERLILALGIADRLRHRATDDAEALASRAVSVAAAVHERATEALGPDAGPGARHALAHAGELLRRANAALDAGAWRRAIVLARRSVGWSLYAVRVAQGPGAARAVR